MHTDASFPDEGTPWVISGPIPKAKISLQYRLATAFVAFVMVLLPLIYIGIIVALGWWLMDYAEGGPNFGPRGKGGLGTLVVFLTPIVVGIIVIIFMIKPLFHRREKGADLRTLTREDEPRLFAFIEQVCDLVHAPRPKRVQVDLQVNASAGLTHGIWSILTRNLTLTIGLPLAGGLSVKQFGGVLAHEFGHFAQGAGMGTTYIVRMISMWFARVVYERDRWDATLEEWARESDWRIMIILQFARLMVWLVRRVLWVLMMIGHFFSSVLMRQMEFDADHYEIQTAGSEGFTSTARQLRVLNVGAQITHGKQQDAFNTKRLVDDLPGWMLHEASRLSADIRAKIAAATAEEKTGWLDTHPCDTERIARATAAQTGGVLASEEPASVLFANFAVLSREITESFYRDVMELPLKSIAMEPLSKMTAESDAANRGGEAMEKLFHGLLTPETLIYIRAQDLELGPEDPRAANMAARTTPSEVELKAAKEFDEAIGRQIEMQGVLAMIQASIPITPAEHKLPSSSLNDVNAEARAAASRIEAASAVATPFLARVRERVAAALRWQLAQPGIAADVAEEIRTQVNAIGAFERVSSILAAMRPLSVSMVAIFNNHEKASNNEATYQTARRWSERLQVFVDQILTALRDTPYPYEHAAGHVMLNTYLVEGVGHPDGMVLTVLRADAIRERLYNIYGRAIGRLAILAFDAEAAMDKAAQ